ncbi:MAG: GNAT family N-acetyltransferase [Planctomycetes bacterium]|nr:GNAT family N-acetyltransferase [Planctomycetota bacterium]
MLRWEVLTSSDPRWGGLGRMPGATVFHSARWCRALERGFGGAVEAAALVDDSGAVAAAWPACRLRLGPVRMLYGVFPKGNFVGAAEAVLPQLPALPERLRRQGIHAVRMIACEDDPVRDLPGARRTSQVRHVLPLAGKTAAALWEGYRQVVRRQVRQAQRAGLAVRPMRRDEFPAFHAMQREMLARNASATGLAPQFHEAIWDELAGDGTAEFLAAEKSGDVAAAIVGIHDGATTYYFAGCSRTAALGLRPNDLLMHALIERAAARGAARLDMLSSDARDAGLIRFKEKWGAQPRPFDLLEWWFSRGRRWMWDAGMAVARHPAGAALVRLLRRER